MLLFLARHGADSNTPELDKGSTRFYRNQYPLQLTWIYHHLRSVAQKLFADAHKEDMQDELLQNKLAFPPPHGTEGAQQHKAHGKQSLYSPAFSLRNL